MLYNCKNVECYGDVSSHTSYVVTYMLLLFHPSLPVFCRPLPHWAHMHLVVLHTATDLEQQHLYNLQKNIFFLVLMNFGSHS